MPRISLAFGPDNTPGGACDAIHKSDPRSWLNAAPKPGCVRELLALALGTVPVWCGAAGAADDPNLNKIETVVVIYAEIAASITSTATSRARMGCKM